MNGHDKAVYFDRRTGIKSESKLNRFCLKITKHTYPCFTRMDKSSPWDYAGYRLDKKLMQVV